SFVCIPIAVGQALYSVWIYGEFMCKITAFLQGVTVAASVFTIAILSVDRFLAIKHPMLFRRISTPTTAAKLITLVWILSIGIMTPLLVMRKIDVFQFLGKRLTFCHERWPNEPMHRQTYDICLFIIVYIIPGTIITLSYGLIGKQLFTEDKNLQRTESLISTGIGRHVMSGRKRIAKMLIALSLLFAVCWLPYYIVNLYLDFEMNNFQNFLTVLPFTILLGHSNSAFNPILYFYSSKSFRRVLVRMLYCRDRRTGHNFQTNFLVQYKKNSERRTQINNSKPLVRILSNSSLTSRTRSTGSLRFSRTTNTSLRSSNTSGKYHDNGGTLKDRDTYGKDVAEEPLCQENVHSPPNDDQSVDCKVSLRRRGIMDYVLSIPTTINEESSPSASTSPCVHKPGSVYPDADDSQNIEISVKIYASR
ncbi:hypothetical protein ScPMuIL_000178, partial [Solemya velum]